MVLSASNTSPTRTPRRVFIGVALVIIAVASAAAYDWSSGRNEALAQSDLSEIARLSARAIDADLTRWAELMTTIDAADVERLDQAAFTEFVDAALGDRDGSGRLTGTYGGMRSVVWVPAPGRGAMGSSATDSYVVEAARPDALISDIVGADLAELPGRVPGLVRARDTGRPTIVGFFVPFTELDLPPEQQSQFGSLYVPIYVGGRTPSTIADRRTLIAGWMITGFRAPELLGFEDQGNRLGFVLEADDQVVYASQPTLSDVSASVPIDAFGEGWTLTVAKVGPVPSGRGLADPRILAAVVIILGVMVLIAGELLLRIRASEKHRLREMEERAASSERARRSLAESVSAGVVEIDAAGVVRSANPAAAALLGVERDAMEGRAFTEVLDTTATGPVDHDFPSSSSVGRQDRCDVETRAGDRLQLTASTAGDGAILVTIEDATAERRAIDELSTALDTSARQRESSRRMIATMSHEVRTPLAGIVGLSELALDEMPADAAGAETLRQVRDTGRDLLEIVNDALAVSVSDSGALRLSPGPVRVSEFLDRLVGSMAGSVRPGVTITAETHDVLTVTIDSSRLRQIVGNLLSNAVRHTTRGSVRVIADRAQNGNLRIVVADTGPGIPLADQERVFEPFFQVGTGNQRPGGAGLGLAVVRSVTTAMGGSLALVSEVGVGSRLTVELPAPDADPDEICDGASLEQPVRRTSLRAHVVDDDEISAHIAVRQLDRLGIAASVESDGLAALTQMTSIDTDIVVVDLHLPGVEGFAILAAAIKRRDVTGSPKLIVAATASTAVEDHRRCRDLGVDAILLKPIDRTVLAALIAETWPDGERSGTDEESVSADEDPSVLGVGRLEELESLGVLGDIIRLADGQVDDLAEQMVAGEADERARAAHTMAGTVRSLGAESLAAALIAMEDELADPPDAAMRERIMRLAAEARQVVELARTWMDRGQGDESGPGQPPSPAARRAASSSSST